MKMLGYICIALGMLDFGLSFNQFDLTGWVLGSTISQYSPVILGVVGVIFLAIGRKSEVVSELEKDFSSSEVEVIVKSATSSSVCYLTEKSIIYEPTIDFTPSWPVSNQKIWKFHPSGRVEIDLVEIASVSKSTSLGVTNGIFLRLKDGSTLSLFIRKKVIGEFIQQIGQRLVTSV